MQSTELGELLIPNPGAPICSSNQRERGCPNASTLKGDVSFDFNPDSNSATKLHATEIFEALFMTKQGQVKDPWKCGEGQPWAQRT